MIILKLGSQTRLFLGLASVRLGVVILGLFVSTLAIHYTNHFQYPALKISINDSMLPSVCYTVIYMVIGCGLGLV